MELGGSAVLVDVVLVEGTDKQAFVDSFDENKAGVVEYASIYAYLVCYACRRRFYRDSRSRSKSCFCNRSTSIISVYSPR